jgi:hypothetical protein
LRSPAFHRSAYAVLARVSPGCPPLIGRFPNIAHPSAARRQDCSRAAARLACVRHAASVQSEPGSNSSLKGFDLSSDDQILNNSLLAIEYSSSICASQTTDASPHTNYLFQFLKSDLHAGRRQKRNSKPRFSARQPLLFAELGLSISVHCLRQASRSKAAQFNDRCAGVNSHHEKYFSRVSRVRAPVREMSQ